MKIGIVIWKLDLRGGEQRQALELAKCLQDWGHDITVYAAYYDKEKSFSDTCSKINKIVSLNGNSTSIKSISDRILLHFGIMRKSKALSQLIDPDLDILNCHEYTTSIVGVHYKQRTGVPVLAMINDTPSYNGVFQLKDSVQKFLFSYLKRLFYKPFLKKMDKIVVLDNMNRDRLRRFCGITDAIVVRSGLDANRFKYTERNHMNRKLKLLTIGTFCAWRRYEDVVAACKTLETLNVDFELNHVGDDSTDVQYAKKIKRMVSDAGLLSHINFLGRVGEEVVERLYATSDIFLFPNYPQTWGLVVFEAIACGIPVIASSECGAAEVLQHKHNVFLVSPKSPQELANAIIRLRDDPDLWKNISRNARQFVEKNIRWDIYALNMLNHLQSTIKQIAA